MCNNTSGHVTIHACPPHRVRAVMEVLEQYNLVDVDSDSRLSLKLDEVYVAEGTFSYGDATTLATALSKAAPDVEFIVDVEPTGELGVTCSYVPGLGLFTADCCNDGEPMFGQSQLLEWLGESVEALRANLGVPWRTALAARPPTTVDEPEFFAAHWIPHRRELAVHGVSDDGEQRWNVTPIDEQTLPALAAADEHLAGQGFLRFRDWTPLDETAQFWRTDVYCCR